jgi:low temperature requirement protein LtrA
VLLALGLKKALGHVGDGLDLVPAVALLGGTALYLLAHVAFRLRNVRRFSRERSAAALLCLALVPVATTVPALITVSLLTALLIALIAVERHRFAELRGRVRGKRA